MSPMAKRPRSICSLILLATAVSACSAAAEAPPPVRPTAVVTPAPETPTAIPPTATATPAPTEIPISSLAAGSRVETLVEVLDAATGGVTVDAEGNLYVADIGQVPSRRGHTVYRITLEGEVLVFAQGEPLLGASGNAFDSHGDLYQSSFSGNEISVIAPDGSISAFTDRGISGPVGIAIDADDNLYVANCTNHSIQRISPEGESEQLVRGSPLNCPNGITLGPDGTLYVANFGDGWVVKVTPEGMAERLAELPGRNNGHLIFHDGRLYVVARRANQIYSMSLQGEIALLAGTGQRGWDDGPALEATFSLPNGIAIAPDGSALYINQVRRESGGLNAPISVRVIRLGSD